MNAACKLARVAIPLMLFFGCATRTYTFQVVDADTRQPMKGVRIAHRDIRTMPENEEQIIWLADVWHPLPTGNDGLFKCTLDTGWWHVLHFCPPDCDGTSETDHLDAYATICPEPVVLRIGDWPRQGEVAGIDGVIPVRLETIQHRANRVPFRASIPGAVKPFRPSVSGTQQSETSSSHEAIPH